MVLGGVAATLVAICVVAANDDFDAAGVVAAVYLVTAIALRLLMTSREREQIGVALERRRDAAAGIGVLVLGSAS